MFVLLTFVDTYGKTVYNESKVAVLSESVNKLNGGLSDAEVGHIIRTQCPRDVS